MTTPGSNVHDASGDMRADCRTRVLRRITGTRQADRNATRRAARPAARRADGGARAARLPRLPDRAEPRERPAVRALQAHAAVACGTTVSPLRAAGTLRAALPGA